MTIDVQLLDEGTIVFRPAEAKWLGGDLYKILPVSNYESMEELWEFPPGAKVRCAERVFHGKKAMVAIAQVT
jgi:hypothetical protein